MIRQPQRARSVAQINEAIKNAGGKERLVYDRNQEYFYFVNVGKNNVRSPVIMVSRVGAYTLAQWLEELRLIREDWIKS